MFNRQTPPARHHRPGARMLALALVPLAIAATLLASGSSAGSVTVKGADEAQLGRTVVVNPAGFTLYSLSPETTRHLLCVSRECLRAWPPLTVSSTRVKLRAGSGVQGKLGILRRSSGQLQVTLRGMPLYRFAGDSAPHQAGGEGIRSFGGVWHAVGAASGSAAAPTSAAPTTSTTEAGGGGGAAW